MTVTVTMLQTRMGESGSLWTAGSSYSASDGFAAMLITANLATGTLPQPVPSTLTAAEVAATQALVSGDLIANSRDGLGRVTSYTQGGTTYTVTYGPFGVATESGGGKTLTYNYSAAGLLLSTTLS